MEAVKCLDGASYYSKDSPYRLFGANLLHDGIWIYSTPQGGTMAICRRTRMCQRRPEKKVGCGSPNLGASAWK